VDAGAVPFADRPAIAVLPFENRSGNPNDAVFADGLADDLITRLSSWRAFPVIARGSSFHYRGDVDLKRVGSELRVRYVVQGSVQRAGDRIRISVQLVDPQSNKNLWSRSYDRAVADVFDLQDEIGATVAASLVADLTRAEGERAQLRGIKGLDAWSAYELGVQRQLRLSAKDNAEARGFFQQSLALEPQSAFAAAALANTYNREVSFGWADSREASAARALDLARRAVEFDPGNSMAHATLASALANGGDLQSAIASAERAVELNPSAPDGWWALAYAKDLAGDPKAAIVAGERAVRLDPQSDRTAQYFDFLSMAYFDAGQYEEGLKAARKVVAAYPDHAWAYIDLAGNAVQLGRIDEARAAIVEARRLQPNMSRAMIQKATGVSRPDISSRWNAALSQAGLE
jgi:adenylate cyclase